MKIPIRPKPRRKSVIKYLRCLIIRDNRVNEYYASRALVDMVNRSITKEARLLRPMLNHSTIEVDTLTNLTYDFLKTSPVYNDDGHCMDFLEDNIIPYLEVDNTEVGNYYM